MWFLLVYIVVWWDTLQDRVTRVSDFVLSLYNLGDYPVSGLGVYKIKIPE